MEKWSEAHYTTPAASGFSLVTSRHRKHFTPVRRFALFWFRNILVTGIRSWAFFKLASQAFILTPYRQYQCQALTDKDDVSVIGKFWRLEQPGGYDCYDIRHYDTNGSNDKGEGRQDIPSFQCKLLELQFCCQVVRIYTSSATSAIIHVEEAVDFIGHINSQQNQ